jgi:hypothetical protein
VWGRAICRPNSGVPTARLRLDVFDGLACALTVAHDAEVDCSRAVAVEAHFGSRLSSAAVS